MGLTCSFIAAIGFGLNYTGFLTYVYNYRKSIKPVPSGNRFGIFYVMLPISLMLLKLLNYYKINQVKVYNMTTFISVVTCILHVYMFYVLPPPTDSRYTD